MKEKVIFWLITAVFVLSCALVYVLCSTAKSYSPVIVAETTSFAPQTVVTDTSEKAVAPVAVININTATKEELMTLNGIGEVIAGLIIDYRNENGAFYSIEEIMEVSGIGEAKFTAIKDKITI